MGSVIIKRRGSRDVPVLNPLFPEDALLYYGHTVQNFSCKVTSSKIQNLTYKWYVNNSLCRQYETTAHQDVFTFDPQEVNVFGRCSIYCQVLNDSGAVESRKSSVVVNKIPVLSSDSPADTISHTDVPLSKGCDVTIQTQSGYERQPIVFTCNIERDGYPTQYSYQWQSYQSGKWANMSGQTKKTLYVGLKNKIGSYKYRCIVKNYDKEDWGIVTSRECVATVYAPIFYMRINKSGTLNFTNLPHNKFDICLVGGGGGGGRSGHDLNSPARYCGAGGGGGGFIVNKTITLKQNQSYPIVIGAGGAGAKFANNTSVEAKQGGQTTAFGYTAKGGIGGYNPQSINWDSSKKQYSWMTRADGGDGYGDGGKGAMTGRGQCSHKLSTKGKTGAMVWGDGLYAKGHFYFKNDKQKKRLQKEYVLQQILGSGGGGGGAFDNTDWDDGIEGSWGGSNDSGKGGCAYANSMPGPNDGENAASHSGGGGGGGGSNSPKYSKGGNGGSGAVYLRLSQ